MDLSITHASFISEPGKGLGLSLLGLTLLFNALHKGFFKKTTTRVII